jgi:hypothetical protein
VPHALNASQKAPRVEIPRELLAFLESLINRSLCSVHTRDETWVYLDNPRASIQIGADVARPTRVRRAVASKKRMFGIDFFRKGIGAVVILLAEQSFNMDSPTCTLLRSIAKNRAQTRPKLKARRTFLHLDNTRSHLTPEQYDDFGITRLPHPLYSQELSPCDFRLFGHLKHCLDGQVFDDDLALKVPVSRIFSSIEPDVPV